MGSFDLFSYLDKALLRQEARQPKVSRTANVWPSEASAELLDKTEANIVGKCHRACFWRMTGEPITSPIDAIGSRRFITGRMLEQAAIDLAKQAGIHVASGVRHVIADLGISYELDLVVLDPETNQGYIVDYKTTYGYVSGKKIYSDGEPKWEAVMQVSLYLNEIKTGKRLKEIINESWSKAETIRQMAAEAEDKNQDEFVRLSSMAERYRISVDWQNLEKLSDGPLRGMLGYESRDDCRTREFALDLQQDPVDGLTYPVIDGVVQYKFNLESVYDRYRKIQRYYQEAMDWAEKRVQEAGVAKPSDPYGEGSDNYYDLVQKELRNLPKTLLPPAEYEWSYPPAKIQALGEAGIIGKTKYAAWKKDKGKKTHIGAWQCAYCPYQIKCVSMEYPQMRHLAVDLMLDDEAA